MVEDFACIALEDIHHSEYVFVGAMVERRPDMKLGGLLIVFDQEGWATLHHIDGFSYQDGRRLASFTPRAPWPDGSVAARKLKAYDAEDEDDARRHLREELFGAKG